MDENEKKEVNNMNETINEKQKNTRKTMIVSISCIIVALIMLFMFLVLYYNRHTHEFNETWVIDDTSHWHKCTGCEEIKDKTEHIYDNDCDTTCNVCGKARTVTHTYDNDCDTDCNICGLTRTITHSFGTDWYAVNDGHYHKCSNCNAESTHEAHSFVDGKCSICDFVEETQGLAYSFIDDDSENEPYYEVTGIGTATAKHIKIPETYNDGTHGEHPIKSVGFSAFMENHDLLSVDFTHITKMGYMAFADCISITKIIIPAGLTDIDSSPFLGCIGVTNITVESGNSKYCIIQNCLVDSETGTIINGFSNSTIPTTGVTKIGMSAFASLTNLTSINIPANITEIEDIAFSGCGNLTLTVDEENAVYYSAGNCLIETETGTLLSAFNSSVIPNDDTVTSIAHYAFMFLTEMESIVIPSSITSIGSYAFVGCTFTTVYFGGTESQWNSMTKGSTNGPLTTATRYYFSETEPTTTGNYWHYVESVPTAWPERTTYKVEHYTEKLDGTYELAETENKVGAINTTATATIKTGTGYDYFEHDESNTNNRESETITADGNLVLKVYYKRKIGTLLISKETGIDTVSASGSGVTATTGSASYTRYRVKYGAIVTLSATASAGYTFAGWESGSLILSNNTYTQTSLEIMVTAKATANTYTIAFNSNGGEGEMTSLTDVTYTENKTLTENTFTRTGYTFLGWATTSTGSKVYDDGQSVSGLTATNGETVTLYAVWQENSSEGSGTEEGSGGE